MIPWCWAPNLKAGVHLDLVGGYTPDTREADDEAARRALVFVDRRESAFHGVGDIVQPIASGAIRESDVLGDLYDLVGGSVAGRRSPVRHHVLQECRRRTPGLDDGRAGLSATCHVKQGLPAGEPNGACMDTGLTSRVGPEASIDDPAAARQVIPGLVRIVGEDDFAVSNSRPPRLQSTWLVSPPFSVCIIQ